MKRYDFSKNGETGNYYITVGGDIVDTLEEAKITGNPVAEIIVDSFFVGSASEARDQAKNYYLEYEEYQREAEDLIEAYGITGGVTYWRVDRLARILSGLSETERAYLRLEECSDEYTGARYGQAKKRVGKCEKIGSGGRNRGSRYAYQVWAVWSCYRKLTT